LKPPVEDAVTDSSSRSEQEIPIAESSTPLPDGGIATEEPSSLSVQSTPSGGTDQKGVIKSEATDKPPALPAVLSSTKTSDKSAHSLRTRRSFARQDSTESTASTKSSASQQSEPKVSKN